VVIEHKPVLTSKFTGAFMQLKFISMLVLATSLTAGLTSAIAISATPNFVIAQRSISSQKPVTSPTATPRLIPPLPALAGIDLTPQQQEQLNQITQDLQAQFEAVAPRPPQLTAEQREKIGQVVQAYRGRLEAVLTPEQLAQLRQNQDNADAKPTPAFGAAPPSELARLNLTPQQQEQIRQAHEEMRPQLRSALPTGSNLTPEQEAKLQQLSQAYNERVEAILTPEQQRQFRQNLEKFRQIREQARPGLERLRENQPRKPLE
jgi:hypothetical protein